MTEQAAPYYEAAAAIGVEIDPQLLHRETRHRGCDCHPNPPDAWAYCPACGKPVWETRYAAIPEWDVSDPDQPLLAGLTVVRTTPPDSPGLDRTALGREAIRAGARFIVAHTVVRTDQMSLARRIDGTFDIPVARHRLLHALAPLGLWDESKFGLWTVLRRIR